MGVVRVFVGFVDFWGVVCGFSLLWFLSFFSFLVGMGAWMYSGGFFLGSRFVF